MGGCSDLLGAFFGYLYYAGLRSAELAALRADDCELPPSGWEQLQLAQLWLNDGVPATEVARRLGHNVAVLLKIYANCIDGQKQSVNDRITAALAVGRDREILLRRRLRTTQPSRPRGPEPGR